MCLIRLSKYIPETKIGWKVFKLENDEYHSPHRGTSPGYLTGEWYEAVKVSMQTVKKEEYTSGFHIYLTEKQAKQHMDIFFAPFKVGWDRTYVVRKVEFDDITTTGNDLLGGCVVAGRMRICV